MASSTTYLVLVNGEQVDSKSKKDRAIEVADGLRADNPDATIEVKTGAGTVVHTVRVKGTHTKPWTRTEEHDGIEVEVPDGYVVSYTRKRVGAVVARSEAKDGLKVITEDGQEFDAANTVEAREITNRLAAEYRVRQAELKEQAAQARAEAKVKREADREAARLEKEKAKAEKAQAKADAKAAKEAEKAAAGKSEAEVQEDAPQGESVSA